MVHINVIHLSFVGAIKSVCIAGNCKTFASGSYDKTVRIWQMIDGEIIHALEGEYIDNFL